MLKCGDRMCSKQNESNINFLIVLDTLREDYANKYIWKRLKRCGLYKYERCVSPATWTTPAHVSMLTGVYPLYHGVHITKERLSFLRIKASKAQSYMFIKEKKKILLSANILISPFFGYKFDHFVDFSTIHGIPPRISILNNNEINCIKILKSKYRNNEIILLKKLLHKNKKILIKALITKILYQLIKINYKVLHPHWPKDMGGKKIIKYIYNNNLDNYDFVLINLMEAHEPYSTIEITKNSWKKKYPEHVEYLSEIVYKLIKHINATYKNPKIAIVSDHGQLLGEHSLYGHVYPPYDELTRVPLYTNFELKTYNNWYSTKNIVADMLEINTIQPTYLDNKYVFSEFFGPSPLDPSGKPKHRVAVYYKDYKGIFNVNDWKWEEWKTYNGKDSVPRTVQKEMFGAIIKHLKNGILFRKTRDIVKYKIKSNISFSS